MCRNTVGPHRPAIYYDMLESPPLDYYLLVAAAATSDSAVAKNRPPCTPAICSASLDIAACLMVLISGKDMFLTGQYVLHVVLD